MCPTCSRRSSASTSSYPPCRRVGTWPGYMPEALESIGVLDDLQAVGGSLDWFHIHPSGGFEGWDPDEPTSSESGWIITDASGQRSISGIDLEVAVVDEIEDPRSARGA
jgi:putative NADH-flavin reductase